MFYLEHICDYLQLIHTHTHNIQGRELDTVFAAQLIMFVRLTGFGHAIGVTLPAHLRHPPTNTHILSIWR